MQIDGQCHCGRVTYQAEIDPQHVSVCHCTDCQQLTGSPYRVTVICSGEQIRMTGQTPKIYAKKGDNGRTRFQHFCEECGSPIFTSGDGGPDDWGIRTAQPAPAHATNLVSLVRAMDPSACGIAGPAGGLDGKKSGYRQARANRMISFVHSPCPALHRGGSQG